MSAHRIYIFHVNRLDRHPAEGGGSLPALMEEERIRAAGIQTELRRKQFVTGRRLMWRALAHLYGEPAVEDWRLITSEDGRPALWDTRNRCPTRPYVSITHSANVAACAISEQAVVGLDVERCKPRDWLELATLVFSPQEISHLDSLRDARRFARCYELWCLKEALLKAAGLGMSLPLSHISFSYDNRLEETRDSRIADIGHWRFAVPHIARGFSCALAWRSVTRNKVELVIHHLPYVRAGPHRASDAFT